MFEENESTITTEATEDQETVAAPPPADLTTGPLEVKKPATFKVRLSRKPGPPEEAISLFSFVDGERLDHFDASKGDTFEKEFDDLSKAHTFIQGALDSGGFVVADDSPVKPRS